MVALTPKSILPPNFFVADFLVQQELYDKAGGNGNQNIVAACLDPMVTTSRGHQAMAEPVVDHILPVAFFGRKAVAPVVCMVRACTAFILAHAVLRCALIFTGIQLERFAVANFLLDAGLQWFIAATIVAVVIVLGEGKPSRGQGYCHDGSNE